MSIKPQNQFRTRLRRQAGIRSGFSLIEVLLVIMILGVLSGIAIPIYQGYDRVSSRKSKHNAQLAAKISSNLTTLSVAHVLPDSLGGVDATIRMLRQGLTVPDGSYMGIPNLPGNEIKPTAKYLNIVFDGKDLHLVYNAALDK